jgi:gamma-glutamyltranspeptidase / glutathione hydrolase
MTGVARFQHIANQAAKLFLPLLPLLLAGIIGCAHGPVAKTVAVPTPPAPAPVAPQPATAPAPPDTNFVHAVPQVAGKGMVVSANPLASAIGRDVLAKGGNAIDAAVATLAALNVVEPHASGLGGGGFLLYYEAARDSFHVIDYRERAPALMNRTRYFNPADTLHLVQRSRGTSVLVPGAAAGWQAMHSRFGKRRIEDLMAPAIALADSGYPVSQKQSALILDDLANLQADSLLASVFLDNGLPLAPGAILRQPKLAETLRFLSRTRLENFYYPPIANEVSAAVTAHGGFITPEDLRAYSVRERVPLHGYYHGYEIVTLPPPSSGGTALLEILKLLEPMNLRSLGYQSPAYIHALASASRQALKDADTWIGDPEFTPSPMREILADSWISEARRRMNADSVPEKISAMDSIHAFGPGNTTHLVVVDSLGNLVSLTQSINYFFGSGVMVPELGLLLNNHMADFGPDTTTTKAIAPYRRPPSNMCPTIVRKNGRPILIIGSPGGARIAPTLAQVLIDVLDFGMPLNQALDAPRFFPAGKTLVVENRIPQTTLDGLTAKGWKIYPLGAADSYFGGVHAIEVDEIDTLTGAADPRRDGTPAGY